MDRFSQLDQALQVEFREEPQAEQFRSFLVGNRLGQKVVQTLDALLDPDLGKCRWVQRGAQQGDHLAPETPCFETDFRCAVMVFEPYGQGQEMRSPNAQRAVPDGGQELGVAVGI